MRILVTGGAGFQGSHLAEHWARAGHDVTILNTYSEQARRNIQGFAAHVTVVWGSVTDREVVQKTVREHEAVAHLAARISVDESITSPAEFLHVNVLGTQNVLEACRAAGARLLFASSCEVYGFTDSGSGPLREDAEMRPYSPYAASKAAADRLCFAHYKTYGQDVVILRPCNIFGARQKRGPGGAVIPTFVERALRGEPLLVFGTGEQRREYMHVQDLVRAYDMVLQRKDLAGRAINVGTGEVLAIRDIARFIADRTGASVTFAPGRPGEVPGFKLDGSWARKELGFTPTVGFWEGLAQYIEAQRQSATTARRTAP
ncbi:MAG: NAD-dependent epimerase/dehydratase family protein [Chloroflexi bacterium]|nr:NAD-dependent epimerase/dehydratase family protein [Chloroflexota bacterium]